MTTSVQEPKVMSAYSSDAVKPASTSTTVNPIQSISPPLIEPALNLDREAWIQKPNVYQRIHRLLKELQPWGVLFTLVALTISLFAFWIDYDDRVHNRTHQAWSLLSQPGDGNNGKISALEFLNREIKVFGIPLKQRENLDYINFDQNIGGAYLENIDLQHASMKGTNFNSATLRFSDFSQAILERADLTKAQIIDTDFRLANLDHAKLSLAQPINSCFQWASLKSADLTNVVFAGANLSHANLHKANLSHALWEGVLISQTILSGANLTNATRLEQQQLDQACGDEATVLPPGYTIPQCQTSPWYARTVDGHARYHSDNKISYTSIDAIRASSVDLTTPCPITP